MVMKRYHVRAELPDTTFDQIYFLKKGGITADLLTASIDINTAMHSNAYK